MSSAEHENLFLQFHAPWCGICASFSPGYWLAARALGKDGQHHHAGPTGGVLAKIDASVKDDATVALKEKWGVKGYPALFHFLDGVPVRYTLKDATKTDADDVINFVSRFVGGRRPWRTFASQEEMDDFVKEKAKLALVAVYPEETPFETMVPFLRKMRQIDMDMEKKGKKKIAYAVTTTDIVPNVKMSFYPAIVAFMNGTIHVDQSKHSTDELFPNNPVAQKKALAHAQKEAADAMRDATTAAQAELAAGISEDEMDEL